MLAMRSLNNEIRKDLLLSWSYRVNWIVDILIFLVIFLAMSFMLGNTPGGRYEEQSSIFIGFIVWSFAMNVINAMAFGVREEQNTGTLEQMLMSPAPSLVLFTGRLMGNFLVRLVVSGLIGLILMLALDIELPFKLLAVPIFILTLTGAYAFGLIIAGMTLHLKRVEFLSNIITNLLLFLNGTFVAIDQFADWLKPVAGSLPTTQGIIVLRRVLLEDASLAAIWNNGDLPLLLLNSAVYIALGAAIYTWGERWAKGKGSLAQY